jgi:hypothetical protein
MIRIKHLLPIILISLSVSKISYAQFQNTNDTSIQSSLDGVQYAVKQNGNKLLYVVGSPFINETFELAKLDKFGDRLFSARYNASQGEMQIRRENDTIALANNVDLVVTFSTENKVYKTYNYINKEGLSKQGFLVVLKEIDSSALLKEEIIKFYEKKPAATGYAKDKPAEFKRINDIYYYKTGDKVLLLPSKRKDFLKLFPDNSDKIKAYIKENKINLKEEDDLIKIVGYLSTIK